MVLTPWNGNGVALPVDVKLGFLTHETGFNPMVVLPAVVEDGEFSVLLRYVDGPATELLFYKAEDYLRGTPVVLARGRAWYVAPRIDKDTGPIDIIGFFPVQGTYTLQLEVYRYGEREPTLVKKYKVRVDGVPAQHRFIDPFSELAYSKDVVIQGKGVLEADGEYYVVVDILDKKNNVKYSFPYNAKSLVRSRGDQVELSPIALQVMLQVKELHGGVLEFEVGFSYEFDAYTEFLKALFTTGNPEEYFKKKSEEEVRKQLSKYFKVVSVEVVDLRLEWNPVTFLFYPRVRCTTRLRVKIDAPAIPVVLIYIAIAVAITVIIGYTVSLVIQSLTMPQVKYYEALKKQAEVQERYWEVRAEYYKAYQIALKEGKEPPPPPPEEPPPKLPSVEEPSLLKISIPKDIMYAVYAMIGLAALSIIASLLKR